MYEFIDVILQFRQRMLVRAVNDNDQYLDRLLCSAWGYGGHQEDIRQVRLTLATLRRKLRRVRARRQLIARQLKGWSAGWPMA